MRYNKQELVTLAAQPSNKFDKEGLLYITERRQEGFFRRTEGKKKIQWDSMNEIFLGISIFTTII